jgi:hypothetical protein
MKKNIYEIAKNNYVIVLFLAIIIFSVVYIYKNDNKSLEDNKDTTMEINDPEVNREEINTTTPLVEELLTYIIPLEDKYTSYQSIFDKDIITLDNLNTGDKLYIAYKYLEKTVDFNKYYEKTSYDTFKEYLEHVRANKYGNYYINTYITKDSLNEAIKKIFNESLTNYVDFSGAMCYLKNDDYVCGNDVYPINKDTKISFVNAYKYDDKIEIIVNYKYEVDGKSYKYFNNTEVGESTYKVTFDKQGDNYYFLSSELYDEN